MTISGGETRRRKESKKEDQYVMHSRIVISLIPLDCALRFLRYLSQI